MNTRITPGQAESAMLALNPRQLRFLQLYLRCYNATEAAMQAGYSSDRASAKVQGCSLMARKDIQLISSISRSMPTCRVRGSIRCVAARRSILAGQSSHFDWIL